MEEVMNILNYIMYKKKNDTYKKYLIRDIKYDILFSECIQVKIIPRCIYIFTDNIKDDYNNRILDFYIKLLHNIHKEIINPIDITNYCSICNIYKYCFKYPLIIRSNSIPTNKGYEIWIYIDKETEMSELEYYKIIITNSKDVVIEDTSITIFLKNSI